MSYPAWLAGLAILFWTLERAWPRRPSQPLLRTGVWTDIAHVVFNAHVAGVVLGNLTIGLAAGVDRALGFAGLMRGQPFWLQFAALLVSMDLVKWLVHNLLHRVDALWQFHKVHHSIVDMDWIGDWRFHWVEILVYRSLLYVPAALMGFSGEAMFWVGVLDTAVGHFAHANVRWNIGWLRYVVNSPEMHLWHHNHPDCGPHNRNFGLTLSVWDWLFGTAHVPPRDPERLGFDKVESYPRQLPGQWWEPFRALLRLR
jgi:sterol desaturase/sphingolipid hydroxylase (fatty acid hydroxylase superfamily)